MLTRGSADTLSRIRVSTSWRCNDGCYDARHGSCHGCAVLARSTGSFTVVQSFGAVVTQIWSAVCTVGARGCSRNCGGGAAVAFIHGGQVQQLLRNEDEGVATVGTHASP